MSDLISVVMSTYNTEKEYLNAAIESVLNQNYKNIEFIIICDGSEEEYKYIKKKYKDERIKLILHKKNLGLPKSLNEGIKLSKGKYIARMDSDDICLRKRFQIQKKYMDNNPKIEICGMYAKCIGESNKKCKFYFKKPSEIEIQVLYIPLLIHPTVMFRKCVFEKNLFYNEEFKCSQDYELWSRSVNNENTAIIPKIGIYYRIHKSQAGQKKKQIQLEYTRQIHNKNALKICNNTNFNDVQWCLGVLYGFNSIDKTNYTHFSNIIDEIINNSDMYNKKILKKILYNRYTILIIKNRLLFKACNIKNFNKFLNFTNLKFLFWYIFE